MAEATIIDNNVSEMQKMLEELVINSSDLISVSEIRSTYASSLAEAPFNDEAKADEVSQADLHAPISKMHILNAEEVPAHKDISYMATDVGIDTISIDHEIVNTANKYTVLLSDMLRRLNAARERLLRNRQRVEDINFICSAYAGIKNVQPLSDEDFSGKCTYSNGTFSAAATNMDQVKYDIEDISGNGYVGNTYVLNAAREYERFTNNTGIIANINDNSPTTIFEYSRLVNEDKGAYTPNIQNKEKQTIVNFDNKDAECVITIHSSDNKPFNTILFSEPGDGLRVTQVETSDDGVLYKNHLGNAVELNGSAYTAKDYSPGCNLVSFPLACYAKLHLASSAVADDYGLGIDTLSTDDSPELIIEPLVNAKRKVISFGGIMAYNAGYQTSTILTGNLAPSNGCEKIAIFANEYIPQALSGKKAPLKYELIVNGETYDIEPINSDESGTKIISSSKSTYKNANTTFIDDKIQTAQLQITFDVQSDVSSYVGNIKACVG